MPRSPGVTVGARKGEAESSACSGCSWPRSRSLAIIGNFQYVLGFRFFATTNFFSYFTVQSAMAAVVTLAIAAWFALRRPRDPAWLGILRTMVTVYVLVWGLVFGLIVAQASTRDYRVDVPWSDTLLHFVVPALAVVAWTTDAVLAVNPPVPWSTVGWVLVYPSLWLPYTLLRGSDVGWYPYFFLDEAQVGGGHRRPQLYSALVLGIFVCPDRRARRRQPGAVA